MNTPMTAMPWPAGAHFTPGGPQPERSALREAIARATRLPEAQALAPLLAAARMRPEQAERTDALVVGPVRVQLWACGIFEVHNGRISFSRAAWVAFDAIICMRPAPSGSFFAARAAPGMPKVDRSGTRAKLVASKPGSGTVRPKVVPPSPDMPKEGDPTPVQPPPTTTSPEK